MTTNRTIRGILFDMDGTLLDTESLSDKALLLAFASTSLSSPPQPQPQQLPQTLPWELKKQILGLRGAEWVPIALKYAIEHWGLAAESLPDPYVT